MLQEIFNHRNILTIANLPTPLLETIDQPIWHCSKQGIYTVKSGYRILVKSTQNLDYIGLPSYWTDLWGLNFSSRTKLFLWRACIGNLPVQAVLQHRGMHLDPLRPLCHQDVELPLHPQYSCVKEYFTRADIKVQNSEATSFEKYFLRLSPHHVKRRPALLRP